MLSRGQLQKGGEKNENIGNTGKGTPSPKFVLSEMASR